MIDLPPKQKEPKALKKLDWKKHHTVYLGHLDENLSLQDIVNLSAERGTVIGAE